MSLFRNRSGCSCCPRQSYNSYKEIKRKLDKLNYRIDWASAKIPDHPSLYEELQADKLAYEVCCKSRKRKIRNPEKKILALCQHDGLPKSKTSLGGSFARLPEICRAPPPQRLFIDKKKPKWREQRDKALQEEEAKEEEKDMVARLQNQIKKLEAKEKFQRLLEQNQKRTVQWRHEKEEVLKTPQLYGEEQPKEEKKEKLRPEQTERDLMKILRKDGRIEKNKKKVSTVTRNRVLNTSLGKYEKIHIKDAERFREFLTDQHLPAKNAKKREGWNSQKLSRGSFDFVNKTVPRRDPFDQMPEAVKVPKFYLIPKNQHLKIPTNKTTNVGAKFSWNFRRMVKAKAGPKPKMSLPFDKLLKGVNIEIPELLPALKSRDQIFKESEIERAATSKLHKSRLKDDSEPNYGVSKTGNSEYFPMGDIKPKFSEPFDKLLTGKEKTIPELNEALMSHHDILSDNKPQEPKSGDVKPKFTEKFQKMLKGKENTPEVNKVLTSHHDMLTDIKRVGKPSSKPHKSKLNDESEPNYGVHKIDKSKHLPSGDIKPKFTETFQKMLRGKEENNPELNEALMSHHEMLPEKSSRPKGVSKTGKPSHMRSSDIKPKFTESFHKMLKGKENIPESNVVLRSHHDILTNMKMSGQPSSKHHKPKLNDETEPNYGAYNIGKSRLLPSGYISPKFTEKFYKMLKGKENIPELNEVMSSHHNILRDIKGAGNPSFKSQRTKRKDESEPKIGKSRSNPIRPSDDIKPKFTETFHKMLKGKENNTESKEALASHHDLITDMKRAGKPYTKPLKSKLIDDSKDNYRKSEPMPSSDTRPKFTEQFHKVLKGKENLPKSNEALVSDHDIIKDIKRAGKRSSKLQKTKQRADYEVFETERFEHLPGSDIKPKLREFPRKERNIIDLNEGFTSQTSQEKSSSGYPKRRSRSRSLMPSQKGVRLIESNESRMSHKGEGKIISARSILKQKDYIPSHQTLEDRGKKLWEMSPRIQQEMDRMASIRPQPHLHDKKLKLEKFDYYIKNSNPDQRILQRSGSKRAISYLKRKSINSAMNDKSGSSRSNEIEIENRNRIEVTEKSTRPSIINTADIARSFLTVKDEKEKEQKAEEVKRRDADDLMFDTVPGKYQPAHTHDTNLKKTRSELIASIAKADKAKDYEPKPSESPPVPMEKEQKDSSVLLKSMRDEIRQFEKQALEEYTLREQLQLQEEFVVEEKAAVQARIQELMKYVVIRENIQVPKPPRDFIKENIEMLQKMQPRRIAKAPKKRKSNQRDPSSMERLPVPELSDFPDCLFRNSGQQMSDTTYDPIEKRSYDSQDQQDQCHIKPKAAAERVDCDRLNMLTCEYSNLDSDFSEETKEQKLRKRERRKDVWNSDENFEELCPKHS